MCKTCTIREEDIASIFLGYVNNKLTFVPETLTQIQSNAISSHKDSEIPTSLDDEDSMDKIRNNLEDDPDDFFGLKIPELMDIDETKEPAEKSDDVIVIEEPKKKTDLQKLCGFQSYQHVIEKAIYCSDEKMLTLNQIYTWIEENIPYFRDLAKVNKSKCWKNAIRHNLSLHKQFYKVLRESHRSCLWAVDKGRIRKGAKITAITTTKKPAPILTPAFRPRSLTEPISIKPVKKVIVEKLLIAKADEKIKMTKKSSVGLLPQDPVVSKVNSSSSIEENSWTAQDAYVPNVATWSFGQTRRLYNYSPSYDYYNPSPPALDLDCAAIIEHERHLYDYYTSNYL